MKRILLVVFLGFSLAAPAQSQSNEDRYNDLGIRIQCVCSCGQALIKCNHVGCQYSDKMIRELRASLSNYSDDEDVLNFFRRSYGTTAVVTPNTHGFELIIWLMPLALAGAGLLLLFLISRRWRSRAVPVDATPVDPELEDLRRRARKETEL